MMTSHEISRAQDMIRCAALQSRVPYEDYRRNLETAIDLAWTEAWEVGNLVEQIRWQLYFSVERKPTVEEFIDRIIRETEAGRYMPNLL